MKYIVQSPDACLAYSLLQIGAVKPAAVKAYERAIKGSSPSWRVVGNWLGKHAPHLASILMMYGGCVPNRNLKELPPGRGIAIIDHGINHAISFCDGLVMDPSPRGPGKAETLRALCRRYTKLDGECVVLAAYTME